MKIIDRPKWELDRPSVLTIGVFDGLHRGHQTLIEQVRLVARKKGVLAGVMTFPEHPLTVLAPPFAPKKLLYPDRKLQLLRKAGLDFAIYQNFTREFSRLSPEDFVKNVLVERAHVRTVVCGEDFCFGAQGKGKVADLRALAGRYGFEVEVISPVVHGTMFVRSTLVRDLLYTGDVTLAASLLTRPHELRGLVVRGAGRGRQLGFPTANLEVNPSYAIPARGVYTCLGFLPASETLHLTVVNIGFNPTFGSERLTIEAHLLDFEGDLVGADLYLFFLKRLRDEMRFPSAEALAQQIQADCLSARAYCETNEAQDRIHAVEELVKETKSVSA